MNSTTSALICTINSTNISISDRDAANCLILLLDKENHSKVAQFLLDVSSLFELTEGKRKPIYFIGSNHGSIETVCLTYDHNSGMIKCIVETKTCTSQWTTLTYNSTEQQKTKMCLNNAYLNLLQVE